MRKPILIIVTFLSVGLVFLSFSELQQIIDILSHANLKFIFGALTVQLIWLYNMGVTFKSLYWLIEIKENSFHLAKVSTAANFINIVAPTLGVGGMAIFITDGRKRKHSPGKITAATALFILFDYAAFICVLALGIIVLIRRDNLTNGEIGASIFLFFVFLFFTFLLYLGIHSEKRLGDFLAKLTRFINRLLNPFLHRPYLEEEKAYHFAEEIAESLVCLRHHKKRLLLPFVFSLINKALLILILFLVFLAFNVPSSAGTIIAGFAVGYLFLIVSVTPSGIGVMESVLVIALTSLNVGWNQAVVITLSYRAVTFWFPLAIGALAFRSIQKTK